MFIDTNDIKSLRDKPIKLYANGKDYKASYAIEFKNNTFTEITKQEYKYLKKVLKGENNEFKESDRTQKRT